MISERVGGNKLAHSKFFFETIILNPQAMVSVEKKGQTYALASPVGWIMLDRGIA
jgi:hypothetical protein